LITIIRVFFEKMGILGLAQGCNLCFWAINGVWVEKNAQMRRPGQHEGPEHSRGAKINQNSWISSNALRTA
jgi:hypothetical protein